MKAMLLPAVWLFAAALSAADYPEPASGDFTIRDFRFANGETLPALTIHYRTIGAPRRGPDGAIDNAVLILHGTTGAGKNFLTPNFAGALFAPGQILSASRWFLIIPDGIGHGESSRPSQGLHAHFPHYTYDDMVAAQYALLTEGLGVTHVKLILGTSMGGMHCWVWGETHPRFMDGLVPLASVPTQIAGRNRVLRKMAIDDIRGDPEWKDGDYTVQPRGLQAAMQILLVMISAPLSWHVTAPTRDAADKLLAEQMRTRLSGADANDVLYAFEASRDYDPSSGLERIEAPVLAINSADDAVNPPELGLMERLMPRVKHGRYVLIPATPETKGHSTHSWPRFWGEHLRKFLEELR